MTTDTLRYSYRTGGTWLFSEPYSWNNKCCFFHVWNGNHHAVRNWDLLVCSSFLISLQPASLQKRVIHRRIWLQPCALCFFMYFSAMWVPFTLHASSIEAGVGAHWFDCWHAHPIQWPSAFHVCHVRFLRARCSHWYSHRKTGNAGQSPFVLVFNRAGVKSRCIFPCMTHWLNWTPHLFSPTPYRECGDLDECFLICERQVVLGFEIAVCTRCARTSPKIRHDSLS
jgi:hypothetical protein